MAIRFLLLYNRDGRDLRLEPYISSTQMKRRTFIDEEREMTEVDRRKELVKEGGRPVLEVAGTSLRYKKFPVTCERQTVSLFGRVCLLSGS